MERPGLGLCETARCDAWLALLTCVVLAAAAPAGAVEDVSILPAAAAPVELLRPAPGEVLVSGADNTIAWRARRDLAAEGAFEWEAFLSFDGGRSWPVRATPHLDVTVSSFSFAIPMVPSDDVRIMLRFGDERREVGYVLPTVHRSVVRPDSWIRPWSLEPTFDRGERARAGVPAVVLWVEGARNGRRVATRTAAWRPVAASTAASAAADRWPCLPPPDPRALELGGSSEARDSVLGSEPGSSSGPTVLSSLPLLLLMCRRNE